jgi:hypothetical protein
MELRPRRISSVRTTTQRLRWACPSVGGQQTTGPPTERRAYQVGEWARADHVRDGYIPVPCPDTRPPLADIYRGLS